MGHWGNHLKAVVNSMSKAVRYSCVIYIFCKNEFGGFFLAKRALKWQSALQRADVREQRTVKYRCRRQHFLLTSVLCDLSSAPQPAINSIIPTF